MPTTLLSLPPELHHLIYASLPSRRRRRAFLTASRVLYAALRVRFMCEVLRRDFVRGVLVPRGGATGKKERVRAVAGFAVRVHEKIPPYRPVVVVGVRVEAAVTVLGGTEASSKEDMEDEDTEAQEQERDRDSEQKEKEEKEPGPTIIVSCYLPGFFPASEDAPRDGDINVEGPRGGVRIFGKPARRALSANEDSADSDDSDSTDRDGGARREGGDQILEFALTRARAAAMVRMTGVLLRQHWGRCCPECRGRRWVCPGCGGFAKRHAMPCPSCVGWGWAMDYKDAIRVDNEDWRDKLWEAIDKMDSEWLKPEVNEE
ncbi:hypothetical protein FB451DRAFT_1162856 [Mycena latifolia]|nr:hypothetical protein FB451DRAFT_1162856 [Mycena latifolia]